MKIYAGGRDTELFPAERPGAPLVVLNTFAGEGAKVRELTKSEYSLAAVEIKSWNSDMTPWPIDPIFKGDEPYTGGADEYLRALTAEILPAVIGELGEQPEYCAIAGYSLAGLFAVYSAYKTDAFSRTASASGSFWYPGFGIFLAENAPLKVPDRLYLSLGDREARTRNPVLRSVEENTSAVRSRFASLGAETVFEWNEGNHFTDEAGRTARAIDWMISGKLISKKD